MTEQPSKMEARLSQEQVKKTYDGIAWMYDGWGALTEGRARRRAIQLAGIRDDETILDVASGTGLVTNGYMFDLMPVEVMPKILAEFRRVLKPTGRLALVNMTEGERPGGQVYGWIYRLSPALLGGCRGGRLSGLLPPAGFQVVTREYHQQFLFPSEVILARRA